MCEFHGYRCCCPDHHGIRFGPDNSKVDWKIVERVIKALERERREPVKFT